MNIKEFLLNNYIWILVVILLSIITIIGFLADKNKGTKKNKQKQPSMTPINNQNIPGTNNAPINYQPVQTVPEPINYQNQSMINNSNVNNSFQPMPNQNLNPNLNNLNQPINPNFNPMENINNQPTMINNMVAPNVIGQNSNLNNPMPVENIMENNAPNPEPMYQPLSEQKPTFKPSNIESNNVFGGNDINQGLNNQINVIPTPQPNPVNAYPLPQNNDLVNNQQMINPSLNPMPNQINEPVQMNSSYNPNPVQNIIPEPIQYQQNNQPQIPSQSMPSPEVIPNMNQNTIPNPITPPQPAVNPQPITFVYGPQPNNNNQNM